MDFALGHALLIAPPPKMESPEAYDVCLPKGGWYDYWTGQAVTAAASGEPASPTNEQANALASEAIRLTEHPALDRLPVFVRAGTILPRQPLVQSTAETPSGPLALDVYPGPDCYGSIYLDDGHSMAFKRGDYLRQTVRGSTDPTGNLTVQFGPREGRYKPWWRQILVRVHANHGIVVITGPDAAQLRVRESASGPIATFSIDDHAIAKR